MDLKNLAKRLIVNSYKYHIFIILKFRVFQTDNKDFYALVFIPAPAYLAFVFVDNGKGSRRPRRASG